MFCSRKFVLLIKCDNNVEKGKEAPIEKNDLPSRSCKFHLAFSIITIIYQYNPCTHHFSTYVQIVCSIDGMDESPFDEMNA